MKEFLQAVFSGIASGSLFAMSGIGIVVIYRVTKLVNFAQGVFPVFAGFLMFTLLGSGLNWIAACIVASLCTGALAALFSVVVLFKESRSSLASVFALLGLSVGMEGVFVLGWGQNPISYKAIVPGSFRISGAIVEREDLVLFVVMLISIVLLQLFFSRSYQGKAMIAAATNREGARLVGIGLMGVGVVAFLVAGLLGGLAGVFSTAALPVTYTSDIVFTINGFAAAIVGNFDSPLGTLVGGILLGEIEAFVATTSFGGYQEVIALLGMLVVLILRSGNRFARLQTEG